MKKTIKLKITGMHCPSCEKIATMELSDLSGISDIKIDSKLGSGILKADLNLVSKEKILEAIEKAGYKGEVESEENAAESGEDKNN
ncbi:MAG: hypothetical protein CO139_02790 [Candidatus Moranbacteria bacterium CG_4_9_14_3_um_filter_36_9]|nr:MAG: hypothetical protein CO139_02790 [Candidatus Moranbacteria bacterium CG_4_9_14_3_um_filter_36_9]